MNYNISFSDMNRLAKQVNSKKTNVSLDQMRKQASQLKNSSTPSIRRAGGHYVRTDNPAK